MDVKGEYTFDAPQELVWAALRDPDVLGSVMPGGEGFEEIGENEYAGTMNIKVGPVQGKFQGNILLSDLVEPESYSMTVDGKGTTGFVKATGSMKLTPEGEDKTRITYDGTARVGGRIASVGQRMLDVSAKSIIRQSLEGLNAYLVAEQAADIVEEAVEEVEAAVETEAEAVAEETVRAARSAEIPRYTPPSQTDVAMNVAKDVFDEFVPREYRPVLATVVIMFILSLLFRRRRDD